MRKSRKNLGPKAKAPSIFNCETNFRFKIQMVPLHCFTTVTRHIFVPLQKLDNNRSNWHTARLIAHKALKGVAPVVAAQLQ